MSRKKDNAHNEVRNSELHSKKKGVFVIPPNTKQAICEFGYCVAFHISQMNKKEENSFGFCVLLSIVLLHLHDSM